MRIISGKYKGRSIVAPAGLPVRPTTDFAKTALFNILNNNFDFEGMTVLDLFCGTGSISFEFASRGAGEIVCVDEHARCLRFIKEFSEKLGITSIRTVKSDVIRFINGMNSPTSNPHFDVVFADPPYDWEQTDLLPGLIIQESLIRPGGWLVVEHQAGRVLQSPRPADQVRIYGNVAFSIFVL